MFDLQMAIDRVHPVQILSRSYCFRDNYDKNKHLNSAIRDNYVKDKHLNIAVYYSIFVTYSSIFYLDYAYVYRRILSL